ncbi:MAG: pyridoxal 5'-phosphate synthase glutaminase subunit PdxT [Acutalibacteraceae bacterium]
MKIGVLAIQGAFEEHIKMLESLGADCVELRSKSDIDESLDGIVLPGGESTVQGKLLHELDMFDSLKALIEKGVPTLATCAGLILLAEKIDNDEQTHLALMPVCVTRNAYGRQLGSFERNAEVKGIGDYPCVFIRAPYISSASDECEVLCVIDKNIVAAKYKNIIALSFHPELTDDTRIHKEFLKSIKK